MNSRLFTHYCLGLLILGMFGCTLGHCPRRYALQDKSPKIWIFKYDKSRQCYRKEGISLQSMQKELENLQVRIFMSKKKYDGLIRTQTCGTYTGRANLYLIYQSDFKKVQNQGFEKWSY